MRTSTIDPPDKPRKTSMLSLCVKYTTSQSIRQKTEPRAAHLLFRRVNAAANQSFFSKRHWFSFFFVVSSLLECRVDSSEGECWLHVILALFYNVCFGSLCSVLLLLLFMS